MKFWFVIFTPFMQIDTKNMRNQTEYVWWLLLTQNYYALNVFSRNGCIVDRFSKTKYFDEATAV